MRFLASSCVIGLQIIFAHSGNDDTNVRSKHGLLLTCLFCVQGPCQGEHDEHGQEGAHPGERPRGGQDHAGAGRQGQEVGAGDFSFKETVSRDLKTHRRLQGILCMD